MNTASGISAEQWLAAAGEKELADVIYQYGEERHSRRIARAIVRARKESPLTSTLQLADIVKKANPSREQKHPATRTFQAIRIFINNELGDLEKALDAALEVLAAGGRLVVISFHSLEDRIVKQFIARQCRGGDFPADLPLRAEQIKPVLRRIGKAVKPGPDETELNVRARSAVMRVAEKL